MHQGTCVTHMPWCMSGSLTSAGGENVPGIPRACATRNVTYLARGPWAAVVRSCSINAHASVKFHRNAIFQTSNLTALKPRAVLGEDDTMLSINEKRCMPRPRLNKKLTDPWQWITQKNPFRAPSTSFLWKVLHVCYELSINWFEKRNTILADWS